MKKILVLGAGRSATVLIHYVLDHAQEWNAGITVGDQSIDLAKSKIGDHANGVAVYFDAEDTLLRHEMVSQHDVIVSMLPANLHLLVANDCVQFKKHLVTASYVSPEMQQLNDEAKKNGLLFMCEMGLDPGIDHMSAMKIIDAIKNKNGIITSFKSATGGLVAPESDDNPWHYKVTWNPRNVVLAGQGTAQYLENGRMKLVPYHRLFTETEIFKIKGYGKFESYANRDSLSYIPKYGLEGIKTILRSTLRKEGFCEAWNVIVQLGLTDDTYTLHQLNTKSYADWSSAYLPEKAKWDDKSMKERVAKFFDVKQKDAVIHRLEWLGLFSDEKIPLENATPAQILQDLILRKWVMKETDNDMIVMCHELKYTANEKKFRQNSTLILKGEDAHRTAMAKTVGLPMGIMVKLILKNELFLTGVHIPVMSQVYEPVLKELEEFGVKFTEEETEVS